MKIIGIVPPSRLRETENPYEDNAIFHELYTKRVEKQAVFLSELSVWTVQ